jgi:hypothetical protein
MGCRVEPGNGDSFHATAPEAFKFRIEASS